MACANRQAPAHVSNALTVGSSHVQLYLFNRSGSTVDLRVSLADSVLYYAQVRSVQTPSEISGGRLVHRPAGTYRVVLQDYTHGQQREAEVHATGAGEVVYVTVQTQEDGSTLTVSDRRPF